MNKPLTAQEQAITEENLRDTRPFLWFLTAVLFFLYVVAVSASPALRDPARLIPFTILMILHGALHWLLPRFASSGWPFALYLTIQVALIFTLSWLSDNPAIVAGLYLGLAGETIGVVEDWRLSLVVLLVTIGLMAATSAALWGWTAVAPEWLGVSLLMALFVMLFVLMFVRQMNARNEAQRLLRDLEIAHRQVSAYAQEVEQLTLEAERQRMARELHDTLAQGLAGVILQLEALEAFLEKGDMAKAADIAGQAKGRARETLSDARRAIDDLRDQGTGSPLQAIAREVERFTRSMGIPCTLEMPETLPLPPEQAAHVLRCVSEGLANVAAHAQASQAAVSVTTGPDHVAVTVSDNGRGFDLAGVPGGHYGLLGLRERARLAGGTLAVSGGAQGGTILTMTLPIQGEDVS